VSEMLNLAARGAKLHIDGTVRFGSQTDMSDARMDVKSIANDLRMTARASETIKMTATPQTH